jgi:tetratricopeptide (TPR) repeat protein
MKAISVMTPLAVFLIALGVRLPYLVALGRTPFLAHPTLDPRLYDGWAQRIAAGEWLGREVFFANPLYPYWLGVLYAVFGRNLGLVHLLQHVLGSLAAALLAWLGMRLWDRRVGWIAGLGAAFYAPFVFHEGTLMIESLAPFLATVALALAVIAGVRRTPGASLAAGIAGGIFVLARPNLTPLASAGWVGTRGRRALAPVILVLLGAMLAIAPVTIRNWIVSRTFVPITAHGGEAFYVGNHAGSDGYGTQPDFVDSGPMTEHESYRQEASHILGRELTLAESSDYWRRQALVFARAEPAQYLGLLLRKAYLFFHAYERGDNHSFYAMRDVVPYLRWIPLGFGWILPFAVLGLWVSRRAWARVGIVPLFAATYAVGVILFFVTARYRLPAVPPLLLLAGSGAVWGWDALRARRVREVAAAAGAVAALALLVNLPSPLVVHEDQATIRNNHGLVLEESGDFAGAAREYQRAVALAPERPLYHYNLAIAERRQGLDASARAHLERAIALDPRHSLALAELGSLLERSGDAAGAIAAYERAQAIEPTLVGPALNAAVLLEKSGRFAEAEPMFRRAVAANPDAYRENLGLALFLARHGRDCEALPYFAAARRGAPAGAAARIDSVLQVLDRECGGATRMPGAEMPGKMP